MKISALTSRHRHRHWHRHRHSNRKVVFTEYISPLELKFLYIFVKHVFVNKVATYRLEGPATLLENVFENVLIIQKSCCAESMHETLCVGVLFNKIAETNSRFLVKKGLHQGGLPVNISELSALLQEGLT